MSVQPDGEIHRLTGGKVVPGHGQEVILRQLPLQILAEVVPPPAVAVVVQAKGIVCRLVPVLQRRQGQARRGEGGDLPQTVGLAADLEPQLPRQAHRQVLQLGCPQALVPGVVLPVDVGAVAAEVGGKGLDQGGICPLVGIQGLFHMDDQGVAALFRQTHGHQPTLRQQAAAQQPALRQQPGQGLGIGQLPLGVEAGFLELLLIVPPEVLDEGHVLPGKDHEPGIGVLLAELVDVVALAAVFPPGKGGHILRPIQVILPVALVGQPEPGPAQQQLRGLLLRHHGDHRRRSRLGAVFLNGRQGGIHVAAGARHRKVEYPLAVHPVADNEASRLLGEGGPQVQAPHELCSGGIFTQVIVAPVVVAAQQGVVFNGQGGK